ncbi:hypothetical protein H920_15108 [Fukomys damarensis]|uniref:Uncharacterized protein n=1 Tax=Fukomys damarensis TaxID=885580 RepID=A0A091D047_FUKDA|nr:hypothetical protein H920_15108 [Fukomys damarensis]
MEVANPGYKHKIPQLLLTHIMTTATEKNTFGKVSKHATMFTSNGREAYEQDRCSASPSCTPSSVLSAAPSTPNASTEDGAVAGCSPESPLLLSSSENTYPGFFQN